MIRCNQISSTIKKYCIVLFVTMSFFTHSFAMSKKVFQNDEKTLSLNMYYKEKIALPSNAVLNISLEDTSKTGLSSEVISSVSIKNITTIPYKTNLEYDPEKIKKGNNYTVIATIKYEDKLLFTTTSVINPFNQNDKNVIPILVQSAKRANSNVGLINTHWQLIQIGKHKISRSNMNDQAYLILESDKPSLKGFGSCNGFFGTYELNKNVLSFGTIGSTEMMCSSDEVMQTEMEFFELLSSVVTWKIQGERLELNNSKMGIKAYFQRKVNEQRVQYLCDKNEQIEVLYNTHESILYYKNKTIPMRIVKNSPEVKYIALDEQNSYQWKIHNDEGILGFLEDDHTSNEQVILRCYKK